MFENLSDRLERSFKILKGEGKITEINVAETLKDVRRALLDADVNYKVAKTFTDTVKQKALGMNVLTAVKPGLTFPVTWGSDVRGPFTALNVCCFQDSSLPADLFLSQPQAPTSPLGSATWSCPISEGT